MLRFGLILFACAALAQEATIEAPKELDEALRARVTKFFQAHVDGKFRVADEVVAADSKDYFFEAEKPRYRGFAIKSVKYSEDFLRALVVVDCDTDMNVPRIGRMAVKVPRTTRWKFVDGDWYWFVDPKQAQETPFGPMKGGPGGDLPIIPKADPGTVQGMARRISADRTQVVLLSNQPSSDAVTVSNTLAGWVTVQVFPPEVPGLSVRLEKADVPPNGSGKIIFDYKPAGAPPEGKQVATVNVQPMGVAFVVGIEFRTAPEQPAAQVVEQPKPEPAKTAPTKDQKKRRK